MGGRRDTLRRKDIAMEVLNLKRKRSRRRKRK